MRSFVEGWDDPVTHGFRYRTELAFVFGDEDDCKKDVLLIIFSKFRSRVCPRDG